MFLPLMGEVAGIYTEPELHHIRMLYAEKVTMVDKWLGYLLDKVRALGLEENTLFMLVSDHGEPLGNGEHGHGIMRKCRPWPYEELVHAPMIMRGPGLPAGKRVKGFTQSCDVAPTVTDWLGIGVHPEHARARACCRWPGARWTRCATSPSPATTSTRPPSSPRTGRSSTGLQAGGEDRGARPASRSTAWAR